MRLCWFQSVDTVMCLQYSLELELAEKEMIDFITFHIWLDKHSVDLCLKICHWGSTKVLLFPAQTTNANRSIQLRQITVKPLKAQYDKHELILKDICSG